MTDEPPAVPKRRGSAPITISNGRDNQIPESIKVMK